jgi:hypothetical protein
MIQPKNRQEFPSIRIGLPRADMIALMLMLTGVFMPSKSEAEVSYTYDQLGRVTMVLYDNGLCITYSYDPDGNRIAQNTAVEAPVWGSSVWRCSHWTPQ